MQQLISFSYRFKGKPPRSYRRLYVSKDNLPRHLSSLAGKRAVHECLILSTCLRFEIYAVGEDDILRAVDEYLRESFGSSQGELTGGTVREGPDAARHLFSVACGLDSEIIGEKQIVRQIKDVYCAGFEEGTTGPVLNRLFQKSLNVSKTVRTRTNIDRGAYSAPSLAARMLCDLLGSLEGKRALVLGAGQIGKLAGLNLHSRGCSDICFISRSVESAEALARQCGASFAPLSRLHERLEAVDILVTATGAPHEILHHGDIQDIMRKRGGGDLFIVDLADPPDIDPCAAHIAGVTLRSLEDVNELASGINDDRAVAICESWAIIEEEVANLYDTAGIALLGVAASQKTRRGSS
jgi:glutamyl-tRNA reductase